MINLEKKRPIKMAKFRRLHRYKVLSECKISVGKWFEKYFLPRYDI